MSFPVPQGVLLPCLRCGEPDAVLTFKIGDGETFFCCECEEEFTWQHAANVVQVWSKVLPILSQCQANIASALEGIEQ